MNASRKKKFLDPNLKNKSKTVENKIQLFEFNGEMLPLPTEIEISESGTCNRSCSFCPRSSIGFEDKKEFITNELHQKLCSQLKELNYEGTIRYSGFVEPLIDKASSSHVALAGTKSTIASVMFNCVEPELGVIKFISLPSERINA